MKEKESQTLLVATLESEKKERARIASDLHDGVSSDLSAIRNYLVVLLKEEVNLERIVLLKDLKGGIDEAIENTRLISYKLMPPLLELTGFVVTLEDFFDELTKRTRVSFQLVQESEIISIHSDAGYELFRILQEFTTNMLKYGKISTCVVTLRQSLNILSIVIVDDGIPFNFALQSTVSKGTGLKNISSRIKVLHATLEQKILNEGNYFIIRLPN